MFAKRWILIGCACFWGMFLGTGCGEDRADSTAEPAAEPAAQEEPSPTVSPQPEPNPAPDSEPEQAPDVVPSPSPEPNPVPEPNPIPEPSEPVVEPAQEPEAEPQPEPAPNPVAEPNPEPDPLGRWEEVAAVGSGPVQEVSVVSLAQEMYVIGGFNDVLQVLPSVEVYSPSTDSWRFIEDMPVRMHHANAAVVHDKLYIVGFLTGLGFTPDGRVFVYDPQTDTWQPKGSMPEGTQRGASAVGVIDGWIYIVGGLRGSAVPDFSRYDPEADLWEDLPALPENLDHIVGGVVDGIFYTVGGRSRSISNHVPSTYAFDPAENTWEARAPMPTSRAGHAAAVWDGKMYVFGGEGNPDHPSGVFDEVEVYDPQTDTWETLAPMRTRRHGTGAAAIDGRIYIPGGADVDAFGAIERHEVFHIPQRP